MKEIQLKWTVLSDGWTEAPEAIVLRGGSWRRKVRFHATAFLLEHPEAGYVLFDTGYSSRFFAETRRWPGVLYRLMTPVVLTEPRGIVSLLERRGIGAEEIRHVIMSHFHADHLGGLRDFPKAKVHCSKAAWEAVRWLRGFSAVRQGILPNLLPEDLEDRLSFVAEGGDVLGDGSMKVLELPGHAKGQIGLRFQDEAGQAILLAADACWVSTAYRENRLPHPITRLLHQWEDYRKSLQRLHDLHVAEPNLLILPTHCPETASYLSYDER